MFPLKRPSPDFESLKEVLMGRKEPNKVYFVELLVDPEVVSFISEKMMGETFPSKLQVSEEKERMVAAGKSIPTLTETEKMHWKGLINFYYRMGYDFVVIDIPQRPFDAKKRIAEDTAILSRGKRTWIEEKEASLLHGREYDAFPWDQINLEVNDYVEFFSENLKA